MKVIIFLSLVAFVLSFPCSTDPKNPTSPHCLQCSATGSSNCILCQNGWLQYNRGCVATCPTNWVAYEDVCWPCAPVCQATATTSPACMVTGLTTTAGVVIAKTQCCTANCLACGNFVPGGVECTQCSPFFVPSANKQTCVCPPGFVANSIDTCFPCNANCATCTLSAKSPGGTVCTGCDAGYTLNLSTFVCYLKITPPPPPKLMEEKSQLRSKNKIQSKLSS